jgi:hypothetical protein
MQQMMIAPQLFATSTAKGMSKNINPAGVAKRTYVSKVRQSMAAVSHFWAQPITVEGEAKRTLRQYQVTLAANCM